MLTPEGRPVAKTAKLPCYDVSIILNLHNEARYLRRTLASLEEAVLYARQFDITFEIVVVLDNADAATAGFAEAYDYAVFDAQRIIHVRNGSLGLSRNDGIAVARGEYIATADGDDLISFDFLQRMYMTARSVGNNAIIFPEYVYAFGEKNYLWKFFDKKFISNSVFFSNHPYISRILCKKSVFDSIIYMDVPTSSGFAYEDWHFNCECLALGFDIEIAKAAVLFYRQRPGSLLRRAETETSRLIPKSRFFVPSTYLKLTWAEFAGGNILRLPEKSFTMDEGLYLPGLSDIIKAANMIDPAISMGILRHSHTGSNFMRSSPAAAAYFELCRAIGGTSYTDVILLPFLAKGGAEKYILSVLNALQELSSDTRCLVLAGQPFGNHEWLEKLPTGSLFIDFHRLGLPNIDKESINIATFRLLQHMPNLKRIHVKGSEYGDSFVKTYASRMKNAPIYFYYFCDESYVEGGLRFTNGYAFDLVSEFGPNLSGIISDHDKVLDFAKETIEADMRKKAHTLYAYCDVIDKERPSPADSLHRLVWASRIDAQKRPELVAKIAKRLTEYLPNVSIDAFGSTTYGDLKPELFDGASNLFYRGSFEGLSSIVTDEYDALIYTAAFDGLPNIILEAMGAGLPVIAPDIGGISDAVTPETGYLVEDEVDDDAMAERYVDAIRTLYSDWPDAARRGLNGRQLLLQRHSREVYLERVREIFGLGLPAPDKGIRRARVGSEK